MKIYIAIIFCKNFNSFAHINLCIQSKTIGRIIYEFPVSTLHIKMNLIKNFIIWWVFYLHYAPQYKNERYILIRYILSYNCFSNIQLILCMIKSKYNGPTGMQLSKILP